MVYEYALSYPEMTVGWGSSSADMCTRTRQRELEDFKGLVQRNKYNAALDVGTLDQLLAVIRTNKQVYCEALPVFFEVNTFCLNSVSSIDAFVGVMRKSDPRNSSGRVPMCALEANRAHHLRRTSLEFNPIESKGQHILRLSDILKVLLDVQQLR